VGVRSEYELDFTQTPRAKAKRVVVPMDAGKKLEKPDVAKRANNHLNGFNQKAGEKASLPGLYTLRESRGKTISVPTEEETDSRQRGERQGNVTEQASEGKKKARG